MEDRAIVALYWKRAETLSAFLAKITRNLSLDRYDAMHAEKRGRRPASCCSSGYRSIFDTMPGQNKAVLSCRPGSPGRKSRVLRRQRR